jgi:hypothetical protein
MSLTLSELAEEIRNHARRLTQAIEALGKTANEMTNVTKQWPVTGDNPLTSTAAYPERRPGHRPLLVDDHPGTGDLGKWPNEK